MDIEAKIQFVGKKLFICFFSVKKRVEDMISTENIELYGQLSVQIEDSWGSEFQRQ